MHEVDLLFECILIRDGQAALPCWFRSDVQTTTYALCEVFVMFLLNFYPASICEGGLGSRNSVCPSVRPSVCLSHGWIVTNLNGALQIF